jgi:hypothetical protein
MEVANAIGLSKPTNLQEKTYDTFFGYYELYQEYYLETCNRLSKINYLPIWRESKILEELKNGAEIAGVEYNLKLTRPNSLGSPEACLQAIVSLDLLS